MTSNVASNLAAKAFSAYFHSFSVNDAYYGSSVPRTFPRFPDHWEALWSNHFLSSDNLKLFVQIWKKKTLPANPKVLHVVHGFGEHSGRYMGWPHFLKDSVDMIVTMDLVGHGKSEGKRGDARRFQDLIDDAEKLGEISTEFLSSQGLKAGESHWLGHSMGGHLVLNLWVHGKLSDKNVKSVQVSAPFLGLVKQPPAIQQVAAKILEKFWGDLSLGAKIDSGVLSKDHEIRELYYQDRLNHSRMTPRLWTTMNTIIADTMALASQADPEKAKPKLQVILPGADGLVDAKVSEQWVENRRRSNPQEQIELTHIESARHESMNDLEKDLFFQKVITWIQK